MKVRCDFVTNSSSSSFVLARKGEQLTDGQKKAILDMVEKYFFGSVLLKPGDSEEKIQEVLDDCWFPGRGTEDRIRESLADGFTIYSDEVDFECPQYEITDLYQEFWSALTDNQDDEHVTIVLDGDLSY